MFQFKLGEWQVLFWGGGEQNLKWGGGGGVDKKEEGRKPEMVRVS